MSGGVDMSPKISSWLMFWEGDEIRGQPVRRSVKWNNVAFDMVIVPSNPPPPHTHPAFLSSMHHTPHAARHEVFPRGTYLSAAVVGDDVGGGVTESGWEDMGEEGREGEDNEVK